MKRKWYSLFAALTLFLTSCGNQVASEVAPTPFPTPVRPMFTVQRGDMTVEAKLSGHVEPLALHTVYFQVNEQVGEVYANINDVVKKGQLLGELAEAQELRAKADETQRTIRRAQKAAGLRMCCSVISRLQADYRIPGRARMSIFRLTLMILQTKPSVTRLFFRLATV